MEKLLHKNKYKTIPTELKEEEFNEYVLPHLTMPKRGPKCKIGYWLVFNLILRILYTGEQWKMLPIPKDEKGRPIIHYTQVYRNFAKWSDDGSWEKVFIGSVKNLQDQGELDLSVIQADATNIVAKKGGDLIEYSGHKHQKGEKILIVTDNNGYVIAPLVAAPVNQSDMVLLPASFKCFKDIILLLGLTLAGTIFNLDSGFDSKKNRSLVYLLKMKPNIKENPRNRKSAKLGRKRFFDSVVYKLRFSIERTFAWQDKFRRLIVRWEFLHQRHACFHLLAFSLINLRGFCSPL
jgi:transposase